MPTRSISKAKSSVRNGVKGLVAKARGIARKSAKAAQPVRGRIARKSSMVAKSASKGMRKVAKSR